LALFWMRFVVVGKQGGILPVYYEACSWILWPRILGFDQSKRSLYANEMHVLQPLKFKGIMRSRKMKISWWFGSIWKYGYGCFSKCILCWNLSKWYFFYFLKIIFEISASKGFKTHNWKRVEPCFLTLTKIGRGIKGFFLKKNKRGESISLV
jgi:hypothetical protein